jgi:hypothetical protein
LIEEPEYETLSPPSPGAEVTLEDAVRELLLSPFSREFVNAGIVLLPVGLDIRLTAIVLISDCQSITSSSRRCIKLFLAPAPSSFKPYFSTMVKVAVEIFPLSFHSLSRWFCDI